MSKTRPSYIALATALLFVSACSKAPTEEAADAPAAAASEAVAAADAAASREGAPPEIGGIVAPGVAFAYRYAFTLPAKSVATVQQEHASACARLGPSRCRVTGMRYEQPREDEVHARLDFLLAPDIAHRFGADGIAAVEKADGHVDNASVSGENAGDEIRLSQENSAAIQAEVTRLEARLRSPGLAPAERVELTQRIEALREQLQGEARTRRDKEESIATTPVTFSYASEGLFAADNGFSRAAGASWGSMQSMLAFLAMVLGLALPWLIPVAGVVAFLRYRKANKLLNEVAAGPHSPAAGAEPSAAA